jgi:hypothetical protein
MKAQTEFQTMLKLLQEIRLLSGQWNTIEAQEITRKVICLAVLLPKVEAAFLEREKVISEKSKK